MKIKTFAIFIITVSSIFTGEIIAQKKDSKKFKAISSRKIKKKSTEFKKYTGNSGNKKVTEFKKYTSNTDNKEFIEFSRYTKEDLNKTYPEFTKHTPEIVEKENVEFIKHTPEIIEKESVEFTKHTQEIVEKEDVEFVKFIKDEESPKILKEFPRLDKKEIAKKEIRRNPNNSIETDSLGGSLNTEEDPVNNSLFDDFRIPVRENINESYLIFAGWKTDSNTYAFRCKNEKRVRLTFWYSDLSAKEEMKGSEFINVTETIDDCFESDRMYEHQAPAAPKIIRKKVKVEKPEQPKEDKVEEKEPKKKKFKAWEGLKK